ncbi:MAG: succinate dehydrogenase assembly factor 2 [Candidatus Thiodiazotropha sp.]
MSESSADSDEIRRLRWQCRRGMLELDYLFESFLDRHYQTLDPEMRAAFIELLEYHDPVLHAWCITGEQPDSENMQKIVKLIRSV